MNTAKLELTAEDGVTKKIISGDFDEKDRSLLEQYQNQMARLREAELMRRGIPGITSMKFTSDAGWEITCAAYSNAELYELLHLLRPLVLQEEVASFHRISGLLGRRFQDRTFAEYQKSVRTIFEDGEMSMYMQITIGEQKLLHSSLLHTWLNGTQYHTDAEKGAAWKKIEHSLEEEGARAIIITQIKSRVKSLLQIERVVGLILGTQDGA